MTFLELCRAAYTRMGYSGAGPSSVERQGGQSARVVDYVNEAWLEVQRSRSDWRFMQRRFVGTATPGLSHLPLAGTEVARGDVIRDVERDAWFIRGPEEATSSPLQYLPADLRRHREEMDDFLATRPAYFWFDRTGFRLNPAPDKAYRVSGDYYISPQSFASSDGEANRQRELSQKVPEIPEEYHTAIVWLAVRNLGAFEESGNTFATGDTEYRKIFSQMCRTELPSIRYGAPLA